MSEREHRTFKSAPVIVAFARQGIPISTISRALVLTEGQVTAVCQRAMASGELLRFPPTTPENKRDAMLTEIVHLRSECADLKRLLAEINERREDVRFALTSAAKLTPTESTLVAALMECGRMTKDRIYHSLFGNLHESEQPEPKIVDVYICKIRRKLPEGVTIDTHWGSGVSMSPESIRRLREIAGIVQVVQSPPLVPQQREAA